MKPTVMYVNDVSNNKRGTMNSFQTKSSVVIYATLLGLLVYGIMLWHDSRNVTIVRTLVPSTSSVAKMDGLRQPALSTQQSPVVVASETQ